MANHTSKKSVETFRHGEATRTNIPTAEYQSVMNAKEETPLRVAYERRNRDLDPQLVWRGKDSQDWSDLVVSAPPLYIQEKIHPKVLIDDLVRRTEEAKKSEDSQPELFSDFNGLVDENARTEFYQHEGHWTNRMILGDSLQVMASLAEREGLRGKVQCIYMDPPYGIKFNSNFQWSTTSRDVKDGNPDHITREPEQVKAFRDTWRDGIHSYLTYLRDRLTVARDLLSDSGSIFVQIGDENVHRVRCLMDEVFGDQNCIQVISFKKAAGQTDKFLTGIVDYIVWYAKDISYVKYRELYVERDLEMDLPRYVYYEKDGISKRIPKESINDYPAYPLNDRFRVNPLSSQTGGDSSRFQFQFQNRLFYPSGTRGWSTHKMGLGRLQKMNRLIIEGNSLNYKRFLSDFPADPLHNNWMDSGGGALVGEKVYVVQTATKIIQRCILMTTDPGDLVLDPTCGSGTTAYVAEQWGRRWITIDTSRVALALARARIMGARYPYYLLADSREGQLKEAELKGEAPSSQPVFGNLRRGFIYERVPHITLKSIANNTEIDVIWEKYQTTLEPLRTALNEALGKSWEEWEIPREAGTSWSTAAKEAHRKWWESRIARQKEIDASIAAKAEFEYLYDKPYDDRKKVRVAGPFTVESLSPHRVLDVDEDGEFIDTTSEAEPGYGGARNFTQMILENLKVAGVQQAHVDDKIVFTSLTPWPGDLICAEGRYIEGGSQASDNENVRPEKRAAIFVGPEFGTVSRPDLVSAAREAGDAGFDILITCAFNYDAHSTEFSKLGRIQVLKARMNADLHMADDLRNNGKGNLFVIFGEPDVEILPAPDGQIRVRVKGVDVFHPNTGEVRSDGPEGIACWFIDTDYNEESFFVRQAYFLGANDPYTALKTSLRAEVNEDAWSTLRSDTSRPFAKPKSGRIAVKVINHLGDEVMKVFRV